ncbi:MAG: hypothetical protein HC778_00330 [Chamaesiphon sp. CSU_1_12]|nr:hypothetical protein [Chamaesiphon sp. CSU_1_12]
MIETTKSNIAFQYLELGKKSFDAENYLQAIDWVSLAIEIDPESSELFIFRARLALIRQDYYLALDDLDRAIEIAPSSVLFCERSQVRYRLEMYIPAYLDIQTAIQLDENNYLAYRYRAIYHCERGELEQGVLDLDRVLALSNDAEAYYFEVKPCCAWASLRSWIFIVR